MRLSTFASATSDRAQSVVELEWPEFLALFEAPHEPDRPKASLPLWSPAVFVDDQRDDAQIEAVHAMGLDVDQDPIPDATLLREALAPYRAVAHSSSSATASSPRWRAVVALSRPVSAAEYRRLWPAFTATLPFRCGTESKNPGRLWYEPRRGEDGHYETVSTDGAPLDVDALLAHAPPVPAPVVPIPPLAPGISTPRGARIAAKRAGAAAVLGAVWPPKGEGRHRAQLALAGALKKDGWPPEDAVDFLCAVCRAAGDEDRPKREATVRHTWAVEVTTGWSTLSTLVDPIIVEDVRRSVDSHADDLRALKAELAGSPVVVQAGPKDPWANIRWGRWEEPVVPPVFLVDRLLIAGKVSLVFAEPGSIKSWLAASLSLAVSLGRPWLGRRETRQAPALYVDFEDAEDEFHRRIRILNGGSPANELGYIYQPGRADDEEFWARAEKVALERGVKLLVLDTLGGSAPGIDENDVRAALPLQLAGTFADATGAHVHVVHHANREGDIRGTSAFKANVDAMFKLETIEDTGARHRARLTCSKSGQRKADPISLELTDDGLVEFVDELPAAEAKLPPLTDGEIAARVLMVVSNHEVSSLDKLRSLVRGGDGRARNERIDAELKEHIAAGRISKIGTVYRADDDEKRKARVIASVGRRDWPTQKALADDADVPTAFVAKMLRERVIVPKASGDVGAGFLVSDPE